MFPKDKHNFFQVFLKIFERNVLNNLNSIFLKNRKWNKFNRQNGTIKENWSN